MKLTRAQFLKALPAAALVLAGCTAAPTAPADTDELVFDHAYPLDYATQFTADTVAMSKPHEIEYTLTFTLE